MKNLILKLKLDDLGCTTHVWFPLPQRVSGDISSWFKPEPTAIKKDWRYGNRFAYFKKDHPLEDDPGQNGIKITASFPLIPESAPGGDPHKFRQANQFVQSDHPTIREIARNLTRGEATPGGKARRCFDWVVEYLEYAHPIPGLYSSLESLTGRQVDCGGFATLTVALLRSLNIPARCVFGWAIKSKTGYHAWIEHYDQKKKNWIASDPAVAHLKSRSQLQAGFGYIDNERLVFSVGEDLELEGKKISWPTPLLQTPIVAALNQPGVPEKVNEKLVWQVN